MKIYLINAPTEEDWMGVKQRALVTIGKTAINQPTSEWKRKILEARHSPIRYLRYSFLLEGIPYCTSVHLVRHHVGCEKYVRSQRNDRQSDYDRNQAPQNAPVDMIFDLNAESLMTLANKRLCNQASLETRNIVKAMCLLAEQQTPELKGLLVKPCERMNGKCEEMNCCGYNQTILKKESEGKPQGVVQSDRKRVNKKASNNTSRKNGA